MTMGDDGSIRIPVHLDVSQIADDLAAVDREISRLQQRMVNAFNRGGAVRRGQVPRAQTIEDIGGYRQQWTPEVRALDKMLGQRMAQIERAAQAGATRPPPTQAQAQRAAAESRLTQLAQATRQTRPVEIDARGSFFDKFTQALRKGRPDLVGMDLARGNVGGAGMRASSILRTLAADSPELFGVLGAAGAGAGIAIAANQSQVNFQRQTAALASAMVGGPLLGNARTMYGLQLSGLSQAFSVAPGDIAGMAQTLATSGMRPGDLMNNMRNAVMLAGPNQLPFQQVAQLTATLATSGGQGNRDLNRTFQDVVNVAGDAQVSIAQLVEGMKILSTGAVGAARDVASLASIQHIVGATSGIQAGALMQPVMSATGGQALQSAALLGLSPQAFLAAQTSKGGMARIWDRIGAFARRLPSGAAGTMVTEQLLSQTGLLNMQNLSPGQQAGLVQTLRTEGPQAAQKLAATYSVQARHQAATQQQSYDHAAQSMQNLATWGDKVSDAFQNIWTTFWNQPGVHRPGPPPATITTSTGSYTLNQSRLNNAKLFGMAVSTGRPGAAPAQASGSIVHAAWAASGGNPQLFSMMMAQMAHESGFQAGAIGKGPHPGYGIAQFTDTLGTAGLRKYLGPGDWRKAALNANQAIRGLAAYDVDLLAGAHGDVQLAEARYNAGPGARRNTLYGQQVYGATQGVEHTLQITVIVKDDRGNQMHKQVDQHRVRTAAAQHGHPPPGHPHYGGRR